MVRERLPGESAIQAIRRDFIDALETRHWRYGFNEGSDVFARLVRESPSLSARLHEMHWTRQVLLADVADADPDDPTPSIVAAQVCAVIRTLTMQTVIRRIAGEVWDEIAPDLRTHAERASPCSNTASATTPTPVSDRRPPG
ncbi:hypothetical protein [Acrocarpospora sp. B8E8]|uniref:hypothetical protein n=1 Tax=Acrocarpospora sp. B8E8 TaxID=3153572 RepID=UPI00325D9C13